MKLWTAGGTVDRFVEEYTAGDDPVLDLRLAPYDCTASIAHVRMLGKIGVLQRGEVLALARELAAIRKLALAGSFPIRVEQEDCHTAIEERLVEKLGPVGKKVHTGRSRNDQVLTALRLLSRDALDACMAAARKLQAGLRKLQKRHGSVPLPGYTHTRKAMPSSVGLWALAFVDALADDLLLCKSVRTVLDQSPLGTAAGYGSPIALDRKMTAALLGFSRVQANPIYAQMSRGKFEMLLLHALVQVLHDLNRMAADLVLFTMPELGYFTLHAGLTTGSSIMPHKKNPDVLELVRASYHVVAACENEVRSITANLMTGYHRDLQLLKAPLLRGLDTALRTLAVMDRVVAGIGVDRNACRKAMTPELHAAADATRMALEQQIPFRDAYLQVAERYRAKE
jgi:argininosuccinate lyase